MVEVELSGRFWQAGSDVASDGRLVIETDQKPRLTVTNPIYEQASVRIDRSSPGVVGISKGGHPDDVVGDYAPRTVHGAASSIRATLLDAVGGSNSAINYGIGQEFTAQFAVVGDHVVPGDVFACARYKISGQWVRRLADQQARFESLGGGLVRGYSAGDTSVWLEFELDRPVTVYDVENHLLLPCITLEGIARDRKLRIEAAQIRRAGADRWLDVYTSRSSRPFPRNPTGRGLINEQYLGVDRLSAWIDISMRGESLVDAVAGFAEDQPIQAQLIVISAIAEGLHRRLAPKRARFPELTKRQLNSVRNIARDAADQRLIELGIEDPARRKRPLEGTLSQLNDVSFAERLADLQLEVEDESAPLIDAFADWPKSVADTRNQLVHQLLDDKKARALDWVDLRDKRDKDFDLTLAVVYSVMWILRIFLLSRCGVPHDVLNQSLLESSRFKYAAANIRNLLSEHPAGRGPQAENPVPEASPADR